jgi:hypothetical protein
MRSQPKWLTSKLALSAAAAFLLFAAAPAASAQEIYYFSDKARDLEVSADAETLLVFPAAPFARVCQPVDIAEFYPLENADELQSMMLPSGVQYKTLSAAQDAGAGGGASGGENTMLSRHLKLVPRRQAGSTTCAIRLVNEQVVNVRIVLTKMIAKPIIDFRSSLEKARGGAAITASLGSLNLFRSLSLGGELSFLVDETPTESQTGEGGSTRTHLTRRTDTATYRLAYVGTDKEHFKAWKFEGEADKAFRALPMKDARIGDFYFSAFRPAKAGDKVVNVPANYQFEAGEKFNLYVLSRSDITVNEMLGRLP